MSLVKAADKFLEICKRGEIAAELDNTNYYSRDYNGKEVCWLQETLWEAAKGIPAIKVSFDFFNADDVRQAHKNLEDELERVEQANISYPIITHNGVIVDGYHRLAKLLQLGVSETNIIQLENMPKPDFVFD